MAEYAGLEIRIGGDTTRLSKALKAPMKAAAELQREIRQITMAMQFDPSNLKNVSTRIKLTADRMEALRSKVQLAGTAMEQLGDKVVKIDGENKTVRELAEETKNVALTAKMADERYNDMVTTIATLYEQFNKVSKNAAIKELAEHVGGVKNAMELAKMDVVDFDSAMKRLDVPASVVERFKTLNSMQFHFEGRSGELDKMLEQMEQLGIFTTSDVEQVKQLRSQFEVIASDKAAYDLADQFQELGVRIERDKSEAEGLSATMRELDTHSKVSMTDSFVGTKKEIEDIDRAIKSLDEDMKQANAVLKMDPKNLDAAKRAFDDMSQKAELLNQREVLLKQNLERLNTPEVQQAAEEHRNLAEWVENARSAAQKARSAYSDQAAELKNLKAAAERTKESMELLQSKMRAYEQGLTGHNAYEQVATQLDDARKNVKRILDDWNKMLDFDFERNGPISNMGIDPDDLIPQTILDRYRLLKKSVDETAGALEKAQKAFIDTQTHLGHDLNSEAEMERRYNAFVEAERQAKQAKSAFEEFTSSEKGVGESAIEMATDFENASREVDDLQKTLKTLDDVKIADKGDYEKWQQDLNKVQDEYKELTVQVDRCNSEVNESKTAMERAEGELDLSNQTQEWRDLTTKIEENTAAKKDNAAAFKPENAGILTPSNIKSIGMTLYSTLTPAISGMGYAMINASEDIDSAYRNMRKTVDGTEQDFQGLYDAALKFSNTHVTSAAQLLEIEAIGGELGIATDNLQEFGEVVASLADSTNLSAEDAATALGHLANIMKIEPDQYSGFADALVRLGNNGASTEEEIVNIAERIGAMGAIVGMSTPDVLAIASTIAATGQNAEAAGTAISKTFSFMETAVAAAGGTMEISMESIGAAVQEGGDQLTIFANMAGMTADEFVEAWSSDPEGTFEGLSQTIKGAEGSLQKIADVAGMTAEEFASTWESDPTAAFEAFIKGLNGIEQSGGSADSTLANLGITAVRQKQAIEGLMQTVGHLDDNLEMSGNAWNGVSDQWGRAGDAANEAAKKAEGFSGQMQILRNMANNALASLGEGAVPILKTLSGMLEDATAWFQNLSTSSKTAIIQMGAFGFALGPLLTIISTVITSKQNIANWAATSTGAMAQVARAFGLGGKSMVESLKQAGTAGSGLQAVMIALKSETKTLFLSLVKGGLTAAAIAAVGYLIAEFVKLRQEYELQQKATVGLQEAMGRVAQATGDFSGLLPGTEKSLEDLYEDVDRLTQRQADLADSLDNANEKYSSSIGPAEYYAQTIEDLIGKSGRSETETNRLKAAIEGLNQECGTSYGLNDYGELIDTQTGKVVDNTEAIWDNVEARRAQAIVDYYSDAYNEATAQAQEAQDTLDGLLAKQEELKQSEFYGKELWEIDDADLAAFQEWNAEWSANKQAVEEATRQLENAEQVRDDLEQRIGEATDQLRANEKAQQDAAAAAEAAARRQEIVTDDVTGNMKRMYDAVGDDATFNDMADSLNALTVSAEELDGVDMSRLAGSFDGSMADVMAALEDGGVHLTTFRGQLEEAGVSSETLSSVSAAAFQSLYESCGGNVEKTASALTHMQTVMGSVNGQQVTFYVGDNGTIIDEQGNIYDLQNDIGSIPDEVLVAYYGDNTDALDKARESKKAVEDVDGDTATVTINATDNATSVIGGIQDRINRLLRNVNIPIGAGSSATGSIGSAPVIPRHAKGYIATGPTLTNQGWIGEDGVEAVTNWATGGAVVPLTNTKYMLPIADAIAEGMAQRGAGTGVTYNMYIDGARINDDAQIQSQFVDLMLTLRRKEMMNVG